MEVKMKRVFILKGLDCPNCSAKIEKEVGALPGVESSVVNLMQQTLTVQSEKSADATLAEQVETIVHSHEPDVEVSEKTEPAVTKVYLLKGLDCPNCSAKIEKEVGELDGVASSTVNLMNQTLTVQAGTSVAASLLDTVTTIVHSHEPDVEVSEKTEPAVTKVYLLKGLDCPNCSAKIEKEVGELDGIVVDGESMLDTKALTGESVPRSIRKGDEALSGCINQSGLLTLKVTKSFGESTVSKITDLVENASARKAPTENFITTFARYYTPVVVGMAAVLAIIPPLVLGGGWSEWLRRGFVFLIVSCPCALVISIPLTFFGGIGAASKRGVLVKGSNYLEALNKVSVVVFDKTGTLTKGVFEVANIIPAAGYQKEQVLEYAAQAESYSNHPIAKSILATYGKPIDQKQFSGFEEISGHGISVMVQGKKVLAGNSKLMESEKIAYAACDAAGTKFYVAADGSYVGCILIADEVKPDSKCAIAELKKIGVEKTVMLTGDDERIGKSVADELGLDAYYAQLLPDQKVEKLEMLDKQKRQGSKLAFVGDGINDAPVLARADVGIAMGGLGSDAAIEAADVVLMTDEPSKLVEAIDVAKATKRIVMQNIVIALGIKSVFLVLGALGMAGMWEAVFGDVGVTIIAVLNAMRILKK